MFDTSLKARQLRSKLAGRRIGLLGGSFNPPHQGHLQLSQQALKRLALDEVWWIVSPQNPMKSSAETGAYDQRLSLCRQLTACDKRIFVSDIEELSGLRLSADTVRLIKKLHPTSQFVWLAGSDIMDELHLWEEVGSFFAQVPIAFFARPRSVISGLNSVMAQKMQDYRYYGHPQNLIAQTAPRWQFYTIPMNPLSSTQLRAQQGNRGQKRTEKLMQTTTDKLSDKEIVTNLLEQIQEAIADLKAKDVRTFDMSGQSSFADYMVLCTGNASTHVKSIARKVEENAKKAGITALNISGENLGDWVLIDFGDIVVHIFREEVRAYYQLEKLWDPMNFEQN